MATKKGLGSLVDQASAGLADNAHADRDTTSGLGVPHYLTLTRKEARVRDDQADQLAALTRRLNKKRAGAGERITDNTLIRVALDLLLERADTIAGTTETELRHSVGL